MEALSPPAHMSHHTHPENMIPRGDWVWVFASDRAGRHAKGSAKIAKVNFGARYGDASGPTGRAYAIPTTARDASSLPVEEVISAVATFCQYAKDHPKIRFYVTRIRSDAMTSTDEAEVARAFAQAPQNCSLPSEWSVVLVDKSQ